MSLDHYREVNRSIWSNTPEYYAELFDKKISADKFRQEAGGEGIKIS